MENYQSVSYSTFDIAAVISPLVEGDAITPQSIPQAQTGAPRKPSGKQNFRNMAACKRLMQKKFGEFLASHGTLVPPDARCFLQVEVRPKGVPGGSNVTRALIDTILSPTSAHKTQQKCREEVLARFPGHSLSKDWTKPLPDWAFAYARKRIQCSSAPISTAEIRKGASLRCLHNEVKRKVRSASSDSETFTVQLTVAPEALVINGLSFGVTKSKSGGHTYKYARVNVQSLLEAMEVH